MELNSQKEFLNFADEIKRDRLNTFFCVFEQHINAIKTILPSRVN